MKVIKRPPFKVEEEGWGEFDLGVTLHFVEKEGTRELSHDLNFQESKYESPHKLVCPLVSNQGLIVGIQKSYHGVYESSRRIRTGSRV